MSKRGRDDLLFLEDILFSIKKIGKYTQGLTFEELRMKRNEVISDAIIRNFEIIGEAVKKIPVELKKKYPNVAWKEAAGFRDVLIHDYFGIDLEAVWDTLRNNIPLFKKEIAKVLNSEKKGKLF